ncbi:MAG: hypothetical protein HY344_01645 [Candidatus Levybacteria bacterium]|nr:hypothetical protein [Candidatus Levybacteria bacterium]
MIERNRMIIAGPCAAESRSQVLASAIMAKERGVEIVRASLWKPRTRPEFDGVQEAGISWLEEVTQLGLTPATEVLNESNAEQVVNRIAGGLGKDVLIWIGSRNQNHLIQRHIGEIAKGERHVKVLIKNQPWPDLSHWLGIVDHVVNGSGDSSQIILCHRGFSPGTNGLRNNPDFEMAMQVKAETGLPMLIDPSHMGGTREKVLDVIKQAQEFNINGVGFDGLMIEVHPNPEEAWTDKLQQLSWDQFDQAVRI